MPIEMLEKMVSAAMGVTSIHLYKHLFHMRAFTMGIACLHPLTIYIKGLYQGEFHEEEWRLLGPDKPMIGKPPMN